MANNERQFESFPPPVFTCDGHFVKAIFARPLPTTQKTTQKTIQKKVKGSENGRGYVETTEAVIDVIRAKRTVTISEMAYILGMSEIGVKYQLKALAARGRIRRVGGRKQGYWALPFEEPDSNDAASEREAKTREKSVVKSVVKTREKSVVKSVVKNTDQILTHLKENPFATRQQLAAETGLTIRGVERNLKVLKSAGHIRRVGPAKGGHWEVVDGK